MKHSIVLKFIAVFLCAVSLLGMVGSAVGILAMTELGLFQRSFEEAYEEYTESYADMLAYDIAVRYASMALGGCNTQLVDDYYGNIWSNRTFDWSKIGYELKDAKGEVLQSYDLEDTSGIQFRFSFPVGGRYLKVLDTMTQTDKIAQEMATAPVYEDGGGIHVALTPEDAVEIYGLEIQYSDGSGEKTENAMSPLGVLFPREDGDYQLDFFEDMSWLELRNGKRAIGIVLWDAEDRYVYEAQGEGDVVLSSSVAYEDTLTWLELPGKDVGMATDGAEPVIYDAIPAGGRTISRISVTYADGSSESVGGVPDIGFLSYDEEGNVVFEAYDSGIMDFRRQNVTYIVFTDVEDSVVYEASNSNGVGSFYLDEDRVLRFRVGMLVEEDASGAEPSGSVYIYDDVPPQGHAVHRVELWLKNSDRMYVVENDVAMVGTASHDSEGNVVFTADNWQDFAFSKPAEVIYICLTDADDRKLFEAHTEGVLPGSGGDVIGIFAYNEAGELVFTLGPEKPAAVAKDEIVPMSTIPEAVTIHETAGEDSIAAFNETVPEGSVEGTVPEETAPVTAVTEETVPEATAEETVPETTEPAVTEDTQPVTAAGEPEEPNASEAAAAAEETMIPEVETTPENADTAAEPTEVVSYAVAAAAEGAQYYTYYDHELGENMVVEYTYEDMPEYTVELRLAHGALTYAYEWELLRVVYDVKEYVFIALGVCLLVFAIMAVYLCCAAGKKPGSAQIRAGGLNAIPLDLYLGIGFLGEMCLIWLGAEGVSEVLRHDFQIGLFFGVLVAFAMCLIFVAFCFACAAQFKTPGGYWWRNSICGRCLKLMGRGCKGLVRVCAWLGEKCDGKVWPVLVRFFKGLWKLILFFWGTFVKGCLLLAHLLEKGAQWLGKKFVRFFSMLPVTWQWLLVGFVLALWLLIAVDARAEGMLVAWVCAAIAVVIYGAHCFGVLLDSTKRMSKGNLDEKVDDKLLIGSFQEFADELNGLADVAVVAAQKQLKSERMKTELITNVSHDIKTPLTSIINYVDLLQKPHSDEEQEIYLEVLDRQSQRLKKLIEDLMEMSKASTGNLAVDVQKVDAAEAINQALGEFSDKLEKAQLIPVFRQPEKPVEMMADGRLVWRVMSNLLGNAVKYALPGTRVYLDLMEVDGKVIISMKNISREELNVNADELLERFVRGDVSRNTEGSGLGLNIAQSLMELQKGQLQLLVDGDLFKVTLIFPGV